MDSPALGAGDEPGVDDECAARHPYGGSGSAGAAQELAALWGDDCDDSGSDSDEEEGIAHDTQVMLERLFNMNYMEEVGVPDEGALQAGFEAGMDAGFRDGRAPGCHLGALAALLQSSCRTALPSVPQLTQAAGSILAHVRTQFAMSAERNGTNPTAVGWVKSTPNEPPSPGALVGDELAAARRFGSGYFSMLCRRVSPDVRAFLGRPEVAPLPLHVHQLAVPGVQCTGMRVEGMTCEGCARRIRQAIQNVKGILTATVDLQTGTVRVIGTAEPRALVAAVVATGKTVAAVGKTGDTAVRAEPSPAPQPPAITDSLGELARIDCVASERLAGHLGWGCLAGTATSETVTLASSPADSGLDQSLVELSARTDVAHVERLASMLGWTTTTPAVAPPTRQVLRTEPPVATAEANRTYRLLTLSIQEDALLTDRVACALGWPSLPLRPEAIASSSTVPSGSQHEHASVRAADATAALLDLDVEMVAAKAGAASGRQAALQESLQCGFELGYAKSSEMALEVHAYYGCLMAWQWQQQEEESAAANVVDPTHKAPAFKSKTDLAKSIPALQLLLRSFPQSHAAASRNDLIEALNTIRTKFRQVAKALLRTRLPAGGDAVAATAALLTRLPVEVFTEAGGNRQAANDDGATVRNGESEVKASNAVDLMW